MTNQPTDERRKAFEAWACKNGYSIEIYKRGDGSYHHGDTQDAWSGWQAALSHQGAVVKVSDIERLRDVWRDDAPTYYVDALTALISKAEKA